MGQGGQIDYVEYSECKPKGRQTFERKTATRPELVSLLTTHAYTEDKFQGRLFAPNTFLPDYSSRSKHGVSSVTFFVFDVERKVPALTEDDVTSLHARLVRSSYEFILYSSHSHKEPVGCRLRLVLFLSRPLLPTEFEEARRRIIRELDLTEIVDPAADDIARIFFYPSCPPGSTPFALHHPGRDVDVDDLLEGFIAVPWEPHRHAPPDNWEYQKPEPPPGGVIDLSALHAALDSYNAKGTSDSQERQRKVTLAKRIRQGQEFASSNLNSALWSACNLLAFLFPFGTSAEEIWAVLHPSLVSMYASGKPDRIPYEKAAEVAKKMIDRALYKRALQEAIDQEILQALHKNAAALEQRLTEAEASPPKDVLALKALEDEVSKTPVVFCIPHEKFYYRDGTKEFSVKTPVGKEGIASHLISIGHHPHEVKDILKDKAYPHVHGIDFEPGHPSIFKRNGDNYLNSWKIPSLIPAPGEFPHVDLVLDALTFCDTEAGQAQDTDGRAWLVNWLAYTAQDPGAVPGVAVLLNGAPQGTGKGTLAHIMFEILGPENCAKISSGSIEGRFTSRWAGKALIFADEVLNRENKNDITDKLKDFITGQTVISEGKGVNEREVRNHSTWLFASNHAVPLNLELNDRRFTVFTRNEPVTEEYKATVRALYTRNNESTPEFHKEIQAFAHHLLNFPVDERKARTPHDNFSRRALSGANKPTHIAYCEYVNDHGWQRLLEQAISVDEPFPSLKPGELEARAAKLYGPINLKHDIGPLISPSALHRTYRQFCKENGVTHVAGLSRFGSLIQQHRPPWPQKKGTAPDGTRHMGYAAPRLGKVGG